MGVPVTERGNSAREPDLVILVIFDINVEGACCEYWLRVGTH